MRKKTRKLEEETISVRIAIGKMVKANYWERAKEIIQSRSWKMIAQLWEHAYLLQDMKMDLGLILRP